ncbi:HaeII family restriction endonuclease [archaeon]|nr:HaeII family restriction endonuclease [archaeon]
MAEILHHYRSENSANPSDFESYKNISKKWRDEVSRRLIGRVSTSSQKFQDNLFEPNAMPPEFLRELAEFNKKNGGLVENYIYHRLQERLSMVLGAYRYIDSATPKTFGLDEFLSLFAQNPGLKRSVDKAYEITVYALFSAIVRALNAEVSISIKDSNEEILSDFKDFIKLTLGLSKNKKRISMPAKLFRAGVTNAADRGLDMWSNFGPAVQVKHVSLSEELAEDVSDTISADKIILVCLDAEAKTVNTVMKQLPFSSRIQGIITFSNLKEWYALCLSQKYESSLGKPLISDLKREFNSEFPTTTEIAPFLKERGYDIKQLKGKWSLQANPL